MWNVNSVKAKEEDVIKHKSPKRDRDERTGNEIYS